MISVLEDSIVSARTTSGLLSKTSSTVGEAELLPTTGTLKTESGKLEVSLLPTNRSPQPRAQTISVKAALRLTTRFTEPEKFHLAPVASTSVTFLFGCGVGLAVGVDIGVADEVGELVGRIVGVGAAVTDPTGFVETVGRDVGSVVDCEGDGDGDTCGDDSKALYAPMETQTIMISKTADKTAY
jgi:hypothetical protein